MKLTTHAMLEILRKHCTSWKIRSSDEKAKELAVVHLDFCYYLDYSTICALTRLLVFVSVTLPLIIHCPLLAMICFTVAIVHIRLLFLLQLSTTRYTG
ncbi:unnamed protein product [Heligmosomoides polygyrus]|uniref:Histone domain-containing protein n=1 Tax=Heligmosomoides polygyrus TaxID=6339 RepID=A0A183FHQ2_HELPZ|nr:unnamed protein product [Heligmosomoides polygyrus]